VNFDGLSVRLLDTAGIRHTDDLIEQEGINRVRDKIPFADLVLAVFDASSDFNQEDQLILDLLADRLAIAVLNKSDLTQCLLLPDERRFVSVVSISALLGNGVALLKKIVCRQFLRSTEQDSREHLILSHVRHRDALVSAGQHLCQFSSCFQESNLELLALDLRSALHAVSSVTGQTATDEVLDQIFSSFCIGK
jgi:tRNA modification GTPase